MDPQCIARPSPFKVNRDQSTDGGSGHEAQHPQTLDCSGLLALFVTKQIESSKTNRFIREPQP